jgi:osmotically-inducible protein OsmY
MTPARLLVLPATALLLSGCVAGMVAGAASMAAGSGRGSGEKRNDAFMQAAARQACSAHAAQYGAVEVVGVKQLKDGEIIVSGTISEAAGKTWFECNFVTQITGFALRPVQPGT